MDIMYIALFCGDPTYGMNTNGAAVYYKIAVNDKIECDLRLVEGYISDVYVTKPAKINHVRVNFTKLYFKPGARRPVAGVHLVF